MDPRTYGRAINRTDQRWYDSRKYHLEACANQLDRAIAQPGKVCEWHEDQHGAWQSQCGGAMFTFTSGGLPQEHGVWYCYSCGHRIAAPQPEQEGESDG